MPKKIVFPPEERLDVPRELKKPRGPRTIDIYEGEECTDFIKPTGSLEKEAFSILEDWKFNLDSEGHGLAYRFGIKEDMFDNDGNLATYLLYFFSHITGKGAERSKEREDNQYRLFEKTVKDLSGKMHQYYPGTIISVILTPPKWMRNELSGLIKSDKE
jgi:hypothetical protein